MSRARNTGVSRLFLVAALVTVALLVGKAEGRNRADERIRGGIETRLGRDVRFGGQDVRVFVKNGEVMLVGTVDSATLRRQAAEVALSVRGVRRVSVRLEVKPPEVQDAELARRVRATLANSATLAGLEVSAEVSNQVVVLAGKVPAPTYRRAAEYIVADVKGVRDVVNKIEVVVTTAHTDGQVQKDVLFVLSCDRRFPEQCPFAVSVRYGVVFLEAEVASAEEKARAVKLAELIKGVVRVVDLIQVTPQPPSPEVAPETEAPEAPPPGPETEPTPKSEGD